MTEISANSRPLSAILFPFLSWFRKVDRSTIQHDFIAGLTNAFIVLPQGVAFAMIAGLPPEYGLYTAIVPPIVAGLFGSSYHLISGPTTAISIVVFSAVSPLAEPSTPQFIGMVLTMTFLAGLIQLGLGVARMGALVNFVSHSVVVGFTAGAAIVIATSQVKHTLGVSIPKGLSMLDTWIALIHAAPQINIYAVIVATSTLAFILGIKRVWPKAPGLLIGMLGGTMVAAIIGAEAHGIRLVGALPSSLPPLSMPDFSPSVISALTSGALAVSMLGLIEAVSIARSVASKSGQIIDGNQEFIGQGLSNVVGSFFSCYASSGSFTRSGVNYTAGAKTPLSAVFAAFSLAMILLLTAPLAAYLPIASMGGVVLLVAYNLVDFHHIKKILQASKADSAVMITTFFATLFVELEFAIYVGVMLSLGLYLNRTSKPRIVARTPNPKAENRSFITDPDAEECPQLKLIRIDGSIYFGSVNHVEMALEWIRGEDPERKHLMIVCSGINFVDVAGAEALEREAARYRAMGGGLYLYRLKETAHHILQRGGYMNTIGEQNLFHSKKTALSTIVSKLDMRRCALCSSRIFIECASLPNDLPNSGG
ncbi:MAG: SulP family inorganic anion transporter [Nitrospinota bacterium]|nr:SulP family inorganic anion transporter [Nitrospinota bacterium]